MRRYQVGVIGSGEVGKALARGFSGRGCEVRIGTRDPAKHKGELVTFAEAAAFGELIVLATLWEGTENALALAGQANLDGKIVIDATNPLKLVDGRPVGLERGHTDSGGEQVQRWLPKSKVVKAFNTVGNTLMVDPKLPGGPPTMFIAGNDAEAKKQVSEILVDFGWDVADTGGIEGSRLLEPMCWLWVVTAMKTGQWMQAFKLLRQS